MRGFWPLIAVVVLGSFVARSAEPPADAPLKQYLHEEAVLLEDILNVARSLWSVV